MPAWAPRKESVYDDEAPPDCEVMRPIEYGFPVAALLPVVGLAPLD
jgi:hypothetical protein